MLPVMRFFFLFRLHGDGPAGSSYPIAKPSQTYGSGPRASERRAAHGVLHCCGQSRPPPFCPGGGGCCSQCRRGKLQPPQCTPRNLPLGSADLGCVRQLLTAAPPTGPPGTTRSPRSVPAPRRSPPTSCMRDDDALELRHPAQAGDHDQPGHRLRGWQRCAARACDQPPFETHLATLPSSVPSAAAVPGRATRRLLLYSPPYSRSSSHHPLRRVQGAPPPPPAPCAAARAPALHAPAVVCLTRSVTTEQPARPPAPLPPAPSRSSELSPGSARRLALGSLATCALPT